ncbi:MAG: hypothetical protein Fur0023_14020 [Bacteroidia bacterium]
MHKIVYAICFNVIGWGLLLKAPVNAQVPLEYSNHIKKADSLFRNNQLLLSKKEYLLAFHSWGKTGMPSDMYKYAKVCALLNQKDTSVMYLKTLLKFLGLSNADTIKKDTCFKNLYQYKKWKELIKKIEYNQKIKNRQLNDTLALMARNDFFLNRLHIRYMNNENNVRDSIEEKKILEKIDSMNNKHYVILNRIFRTYGFLDYTKVGTVGTQNFWVLVQHQDKHIDFQKKVLKEMKIYVRQDLAPPNLYAYLYDRVRKNSGKKQLYGTQCRLKNDSTGYEPYPLEKPHKVNERRKEMGLPPIEEYIRQMNNIHYGNIKEKKKQ